MTHGSIEPRSRKYVKGYGFLSFTRNLSAKYGKNYLLLPQKKDYMLQKQSLTQLKQQEN